MPESSSSDCVLLEPSEQVLPKLKDDKMASFYLFSDAAGKKVGLVAMKATNEQAKQATRRGTEARKERGLKRFCSGLIVRDAEEDRLVFIRYTGNISIPKLAKLLNKQLGKSNEIPAKSRKLLLRARVEEKGNKEDMSRPKLLVDRLPDMGVDPDEAAEAGGQTWRELLAAMEADGLSEATFQEEYDEMILETLQPVSVLLGVELKDPSPEVVAGLLERALAAAEKNVVLSALLTSPEALAAAEQVFEALGEGLDLTEPSVAGEMAVLGHVRAALSEDLAEALGAESPPSDGPFPPIIEAKLRFNGREPSVLSAAQVKRGMVWKPRMGKPQDIQPFRRESLNDVVDICEDLEETLEGIARERDALGDDAAGASALLARVAAEIDGARTGVLGAIKPLEDWDPPVVISARNLGALQRSLDELSRLIFRAQAMRKELEARGRGAPASEAWRNAVAESVDTLPLEEALENPGLREALRAQYEREFAPEIMDFLLAAAPLYEEAGRADGQPLDVRGIYERFVSEDSKEQINFSGSDRLALQALVEERADGKGAITDPADKLEFRELIRRGMDVANQLSKDIYRHVKDEIAAYNDVINRGVSASDVRQDPAAALLRAAGEAMGLPEPNDAGADARRQAVERLQSKRLWEEMRKDGLAFLNSRPEKAYFLLSPRTTHEDRPMVLFHSSANPPLLGTLTALTADGHRISSGEIALHKANGRFVAMVRPNAPQGLEDALRQISPKFLISRTLRPDDEKPAQDRIFDLLLDDISIEQLVNGSDTAVRASGLAALFRDYASSRMYIEENLRFLDEIGAVIGRLSADAQSSNATPFPIQSFYNTYLSGRTELELNVPYEMRAEIDARFNPGPDCLLDQNGAVSLPQNKQLLVALLRRVKHEISLLQQTKATEFRNLIQNDIKAYALVTQGKDPARYTNEDRFRVRSLETYKRFADQHGLVAPKG